MEEALIRMKQQNDHLVKETKDALDSPGSPKFISTHETVLQLKEELQQKDTMHSERIVEMVSWYFLTHALLFIFFLLE